MQLAQRRMIWRALAQRPFARRVGRLQPREDLVTDGGQPLRHSLLPPVGAMAPLTVDHPVPPTPQRHDSTSDRGWQTPSNCSQIRAKGSLRPPASAIESPLVRDCRTDGADGRRRKREGARLPQSFALHDLRVTVAAIEGRSVCGLRVGDYFEVTESSRVRIPEGRHFCLYALAAVLPLLPAKQRALDSGRLAGAGQPGRLPGPGGTADHADRADRAARVARGGPDVTGAATEPVARAQHRLPERQALQRVRRTRRAGRALRLRDGQRLRRPDVPAAARGAAGDRRGDAAHPPRPGLPQPLHAPPGRDRRADRDARRRLGRARLPRPGARRLARLARHRRSRGR